MVTYYIHTLDNLVPDLAKPICYFYLVFCYFLCLRKINIIQHKAIIRTGITLHYSPKVKDSHLYTLKYNIWNLKD